MKLVVSMPTRTKTYRTRSSVAAVQALRRTLSLLHIPAGPPPVFAEHLKREYDSFVKQPPQPGRRPLDQETATTVLDARWPLSPGSQGLAYNQTAF